MTPDGEPNATAVNNVGRETAVQSMAHMTIAKAHLRELIKARVHTRAASRAFKHLDRAMEILTEAIRGDATKEQEPNLELPSP
jgi:predicted RNA-binding Zn ribbon-like protein